MKKLIILLGLCVVLLSSLVLAYPDGCSTTPGDYEYLDLDGDEDSGTFTYDTPDKSSGIWTIFLENYNWTIAGTNDYPLHLIDQGPEWRSYIRMQYDNKAMYSTGQTIINTSISNYFNLTWTVDINNDLDNITIVRETGEIGTRNDLTPGQATYNFYKYQMTHNGNGQASWTGFYMWNGTNCPGYIPAPPSVSVNILNPSNNSDVGINNFTINFNTTIPAATCDLNVNTTGVLTFNQTKTYDDSGNDSYNLTIGEGNLMFNVNCSNSTANFSTQGYIVFSDSKIPIVISNIQGTYWTNEIDLNINISDSNLFNFTFIDSCGNNQTNTSLSGSFEYLETLNIVGCGFGPQQTNITSCDISNNCVNKNYNWTSMGRINITAAGYNGSTINIFTVSLNGTVQGNTSSSFFHIDNLSVGSYNVTIYPDGYEVSSATITINETYTSYEFVLYTTNSINFTFRNDKDYAIVTETVLVEFISSGASYNYSTSTGYLYVELLSPQDYTIRYYRTTDPLKNNYYFTLTNRTHNEITLYLANFTEEITVTVYDELTTNPITGAIIYLQRYNQPDNEYKTVAQYTSDLAGKSYFLVEKDVELYRFLVDYPWKTRKLETEGMYLQADNVNLYISLTEDVAESFFTEESIIASISYLDSRSFRVTYTDNEASASEYCFYVKRFGYYGKEIVNSSCSTDSSSSLTLDLPLLNATYYAVFTAKITGSEKIIETGWVELVSDRLNAGPLGVFITAVLVMILVFLSMVHIIALILGTAALLFAKWLGLLAISWGTVIVVFIAALILAIIIGMRK